MFLFQEYHSNKALNEFFRLLSTNRDKEGKKEFVSTIEGNTVGYLCRGVEWYFQNLGTRKLKNLDNLCEEF